MSGPPEYRERILGQFAKMEDLRIQKARQMGEDWHKDIPAKDVLVRKKLRARGKLPPWVSVLRDPTGPGWTEA